MRRFFISSQAFTGDAEIIYDADGRLVRIDVMSTSMSANVVQIFKAKIPSVVSGLEEAFTGSKAVIVEAEIDFSAEDFMREYPYKRNTHLVAPIWNKMSQTERVLAYHAATQYRKHCEREGHWYKPMIAASWLTKKEYLNNWKKM